MSGRRIGLLGGSFNPAHEGHRHISLAALARLGLDQVWWLVSPQNPLKPSHDMQPLARRLATARAVARHPRIKVSDLERRLGTLYTTDTVSALRRRYPEDRFVWMIGADNLVQLPQWRRWTALMRLVPIAVFDRPQTAYRALAGRAAQRYRRARRPAHTGFASLPPPAWCFVFIRPHPGSATALRNLNKVT